MHYIIYKTTNLINGKFYIGKHKTKNLDDGYIGSGKLLRYAVKKYGSENFHREILHECSSEKHMNILEKILVVPDTEINYNLCEGGKGGFSYLNKIITNEVRRTNEHREIFLSKIKNDPDFKEFWISSCKKAATTSRPKISKTMRQKYDDGFVGGFAGKSHSDSHKEKMSSIMKEKSKGSNNSQFGTCWVTNGKENKKIKKNEVDIYISLGYKLGRVLDKR